MSSTAKQDKRNGMKRKTFSLNFLSKNHFLRRKKEDYEDFLLHNNIHEKKARRKIRFDGKKLFMTFLGRNIVWIKHFFVPSQPHKYSNK